MILCLLFHRINSDSYSNNLALLRNILELVRERYHVVVPGESLSRDKLNVCISFDDAYFDFYYYFFPLIKELNFKVLLSIPVKYILDESSAPDDIRLDIRHSDAMRDDIYKDKAPFCTWAEIREMVGSGLIEAASHSYSHCALTGDNTNMDLEVVRSKEILEQKLDMDITTFVYPYGKFDKAVHRFVKQHYDYALRIGNALNLNWENYSGILYRVNADNLKHPAEPFEKSRMASYYFKLLMNILRGK